MKTPEIRDCQAGFLAAATALLQLRWVQIITSPPSRSDFLPKCRMDQLSRSVFTWVAV